MILFIVLGLSVDINGDVNIEALLTDIEASFTISLAIAPVIVIGLIRKTEPLIALLFGTLLAGNFSILFQPTSSIKLLSMTFSLLRKVMDAITGKVVILLTMKH
jgi:NhaC family Na+:H+ antiporter